jgi:hypothetical protein
MLTLSVCLCTGLTNQRVWVEVTEGKQVALSLVSLELVERAAHILSL